MFYKTFITILMLNLYLFSQQTGLFKNPPDNLTLPAILTEADGTPKTGSMGKLESKWVQSNSEGAETLLQSFASGADIGINPLIRGILVNANIPENKINRIKINFSSSGIEELGIDKDAVFFNDDFPAKYLGEKMFLITKLFRTKNAVIELVDGSSEIFDPAVTAAISDGLRFGNKTETNQGNKMIIEILHLVYGYEYIPLSINRVEAYSVTMYLGEYKDIELNSIKNIQTLEGVPYDFFVRFASDLLEEPLLVKVSNVNPTANFRIGSREAYSLTYTEKAGNKVTVSISGFKINFE